MCLYRRVKDNMPRPEYRTITVKKKSSEQFMNAKKSSGLDNSEFTDLLIKLYKENRKKNK